MSRPEPRQEIQRVYLAPHRSMTPDWTVEDLEKFVSDCKRSGIPGTARLFREQASFGCDGGLFYAERTVPLETEQWQEPKG